MKNPKDGIRAKLQELLATISPQRLEFIRNSLREYFQSHRETEYYDLFEDPDSLNFALSKQGLGITKKLGISQAEFITFCEILAFEGFLNNPIPLLN